MVEPDLVTLPDAITAMNCGTVSGGCELLPGRLVQCPPQLAGTISVKPLNESGAAPPLRVLSFAHFAPQNVTVFPGIALPSPITNCALNIVTVN